MSIEQDTIRDSDLPQESPFEQELDRQQTASEREYERRWWTLGVLCLSLVMIVMANASLNVALPTLADDLARRRRARCSGSSTRTASCSPACCSPPGRSVTATDDGSRSTAA